MRELRRKSKKKFNSVVEEKRRKKETVNNNNNNNIKPANVFKDIVMVDVNNPSNHIVEESITYGNGRKVRSIIRLALKICLH